MDLKKDKEVEVEEIFYGIPEEIFKKLVRVANLGEKHTIYQKLIYLMSLVPLVSSNILIFSFGEADMGKSYFYVKILNLDKMGEFPTKADLRGSKIGSGCSEALLKKKFLLLEEIKDNSIAEDDLGILKEAITSKTFMAKEGEQNTEISLVMVFNEYSEIKNIKDLKIEKIKQVLPYPLRDKAILSRIKIFLPFYRSLIGDKNFLPQLNIDFEKFTNHLFSLRKFEIADEELQVDMIKRKKENVLDVSYGILKLLCPSQKLSQIPVDLKNAIIEITRHFIGLGEGEFNSLLTNTTVKWIARFQGIQFSDDAKFYILSESRFLVEDRIRKTITVSAVIYSGCLENKKIFLEFLGQENDFQILRFKLDKNIENIQSIVLNEWETKEKIKIFQNKFQVAKEKIFELIKHEIQTGINEIVTRGAIFSTWIPLELLVMNGLTDKNISCFSFQARENDYIQSSFYYVDMQLLMSLLKELSEYLEIKIKKLIFENDSISIKRILSKIDIFLASNLSWLREYTNFEILRTEGLEIIPELELDKGIINNDIKKLILMKIETIIDEKIPDDFIFYIDTDTLEPRLIVS